MNHITYGISKEIYTLGEECRKAFGIVAYADADEDGTATIVKSIPDVTDDEKALAELIERCNRGRLSLVHLPDVIEDFIG